MHLIFIDNPFKEVGVFCHVQPFYLNSKSQLHCLCVFFCSQPASQRPCRTFALQACDFNYLMESIKFWKGETDYNFSVNSCLVSSFLGNRKQVCSRFERRGLSGSLVFLWVSDLGLQVVSSLVLGVC